MPSVVIEVEVTTVGLTKIYFLKCRLSANFRYPYCLEMKHY